MKSFITYFLLCILLVSISGATEKSKTNPKADSGSIVWLTPDYPPICGWTGTLKEDGKCAVSINAPPEYDGFSCETKPRKTGERYIVECTWTPKKDSGQQIK